jgi:hypothetical protein
MTIKLTVTYWRDIPSQVEARKSRNERTKIMLSERFMIAIDKAAMNAKLHSSDDYLKEWKKSNPITSELNSLEEAAQKLAQSLEEQFSDALLKEIVSLGGFKNSS